MRILFVSDKGKEHKVSVHPKLGFDDDAMQIVELRMHRGYLYIFGLEDLEIWSLDSSTSPPVFVTKSKLRIEEMGTFLVSPNAIDICPIDVLVRKRTSVPSERSLSLSGRSMSEVDDVRSSSSLDISGSERSASDLPLKKNPDADKVTPEAVSSIPESHRRDSSSVAALKKSMSDSKVRKVEGMFSPGNVFKFLLASYDSVKKIVSVKFHCIYADFEYIETGEKVALEEWKVPEGRVFQRVNVDPYGRVSVLLKDPDFGELTVVVLQSEIGALAREKAKAKPIALLQHFVPSEKKETSDGKSKAGANKSVS